MKTIIGLVVTSLSLSACGYNTPQNLPSRDILEEKVDVGGYQLQFKYTPGIEPVIVFESGGGNDSNQWRDIQEALPYSIRNALVSYDRAGHGDSELSINGYDIEAEMAALHTGLETLGLGDDVILVGHSYAGLLVQMYAHKYPDSVNNILFIDPNNAYYATIADAKQAVLEELDSQRPDDNWGTAVKSQMLAYVETIEKSKRVLQTSSSPNQNGCVVITAGEKWHESAELNERWRQSHVQLAATCATALVVASGKQHMLPSQAEALVISEIVKMAKL
ncbi:alpha/beta hydrolase [Shewanella sp. KX20019]|uniref:alpha/beta fold hydrolase n=1 Tax=Shewanella sp. KX20019 TaxID=2803864 RepID=UPI001925BD83|nr:alpha/beta hydrolase [Shewanella sp. KX20019]QQX80757.1 alpha/beta hydrolase [Shewanella sp. KX20019]